MWRRGKKLKLRNKVFGASVEVSCCQKTHPQRLGGGPAISEAAERPEKRTRGAFRVYVVELYTTADAQSSLQTKFAFWRLFRL